MNELEFFVQELKRQIRIHCSYHVTLEGVITAIDTAWSRTEREIKRLAIFDQEGK